MRSIEFVYDRVILSSVIVGSGWLSKLNVRSIHRVALFLLSTVAKYEECEKCDDDDREGDANSDADFVAGGKCGVRG